MGSFVCLGCATIAVALYIFDLFIEKRDKEWFEEYKERKRERGELDLDERTAFKQAEDIEGDFQCSDIKTFEAPFWMTACICMCTYISVVNSIVIASAVL